MFFNKLIKSKNQQSIDSQKIGSKNQYIKFSYFYRTLSGKYVRVNSDPEEKRFILLDKSRNQILCLNHGIWEPFSVRGKQLFCSQHSLCNGIPFIFNKFEDEVFEANIERYGDEKDLLDLDENGISRDLVIIKISENYTTGKFNIQLIIINHKLAQSLNKAEVRNIPRIRCNYSFDIIKDNYYFNRGGYENCNKKLTRLYDCLPKNVYIFALERLKTMLRYYFKKNLSLSYTGDKNKELYAITHFPYEPNLTDLSEYTNIRIPRTEMNGFNMFCMKYGIRSYKTLHKIYLEKDSMVIVVYKGLIEAGFKDVNIMNTVYGTSLAKLFYYSESEYGLYRNIKIFCKNILQIKNEKTVLNILKRSEFEESNYGGISDDAIIIFNRYYDNMPAELKKDVLENGFTKRTHDELVKYDYTMEHKTVVFKYKKEDRDFEDNINGYEFSLPKDSKELYLIGASLHNCVGSYTDRILDKYCLIVYAMKDGEYRICIEIRGNKIIQQRVDYNMDPTGDDAVVMKLWKEKHGLVFSGNQW